MNVSDAGLRKRRMSGKKTDVSRIMRKRGRMAEDGPRRELVRAIR